MTFRKLLLILAITQVNNGCNQEPKPCRKHGPKLFTTCVNGVQMWQTISGERGLMVRIDGFKPMACK